ncbi:hypothetical protein M3F59_11830 [Brachybacterium muris]|uniref:hypothetical protein n=1 Tax=Brachybacterium muris TaxID=219301 RepID=UPI00223A76FE|nr:hypothetical protein [Brachybacterium muris]MCT2177005.1 hypothetical protein [Brachybacterium muris]MCT2262302.1 hypothetical protein [Brachybacterium muris]
MAEVLSTADRPADGAAGGGAPVDATAAGTVEHGSLPQKQLIPLLMKLKWALWKRSYRKNVGKIIGTVIGVLYAGGGLVGLVFAFIGLTMASGEGAMFPAVIRGLGAVTVLAWLLIPIFAFGLDDTLDPRRFALFPRSAKELQPGMFAAAALSLPTLLTAVAVAIATVFEVIWLLAFGAGTLWVVLALVALIPANLAGIALCLLLPRAWFAHSASRSSSRSGRELGGIFGMLLFLGVIYGFSVSVQGLTDLDFDLVRKWSLLAVSVLAWTPFGALFAIPMDLAEGQVLVALVRALIGAVTIVAVWLWWRRSLDLALTSALTGDASSGTAKVTSLVPRWVKPSPFGAALGRSLRYWRRDTRYLAAVAIYPLVFVFLIAMGLVLPESRPMMLVMAVFMAGMTGISLSNEIGFDGPAGWVNITAGMDARANLLGRVAAIALIMVPAALLAMVAIPLLYGVPHLIPLLVLGTAGLMLTGWGVSLIVGVLLPYPTSAPGTNPMKDKSASSANAFLAMGAASLGVFVPQLPAIGLAAWGVLSGSLMIQIIAGVVALAIGVLMLWLGVRIGSRRLSTHSPELFQKVRDHV